MKQLLKEKFNTLYIDSNGQGSHTNTIHYFFSPGRVNLIGEHTDYNGGHVFPCALTMGTYAAVAKNNLGIVRLFSENFSEEGMRQFPINAFNYSSHNGWTNYALGVFDQLAKRVHHMSQGVDFYIAGDIPNGAGLSSSASLELLVAVAVNELFQYELDRLDLVKLCQRAENDFVGVNCGIMDQFAIGMAKENHAILLDTQTMAYTQTPLRISEEKVVILIGNTNKTRELAGSKYNERRAECQTALKELQTVLSIKSLGDLDEKTFEEHASLITSDVNRKRARHAVYENQRTLQAVNVLNKGDLKAFGELMIASHLSLQNDYDVSCKELDVLVQLTLEHSGTIGARMTGAGFGGCIVSLVHRDAVDDLIEKIAPAYEALTGYRATFYQAEMGKGTCVMEDK